jgi:hypothetical protein
VWLMRGTGGSPNAGEFSAPTAAEVMGRNVRRLRGHHSTDDLAQHLRPWGLTWGTAKIFEVENGRVSPTLPTIYLLTQALSELLGVPVPASELFAGDGKVKIPGGEIELRFLQSSLSGKRPDRPKPDMSRQRAEIAAARAGWPDRLHRLGALRIYETRLAMKETDVRIGRDLSLVGRDGQVDHDRVAAEMTFLWGRPLSAERDELAGADATPQARGRISRQLVAQLKKVLDGDR